MKPTTTAPQTVRYTLSEFQKEVGDDMTGYIVEYETPLDVAVYPEYEGDSFAIVPVGYLTGLGRFQLVESGFGSRLTGHGRMIGGPFFDTLEHAQQNDTLKATVPENLKDWFKDTYPDAIGLTVSSSTKVLPSWVHVPVGGSDE